MQYRFRDPNPLPARQEIVFVLIGITRSATTASLPGMKCDGFATLDASEL
jgi:hypothetical protein